MKRLINIALASTVVMLLSTGCGNSNTKNVEEAMNVGAELNCYIICNVAVFIGCEGLAEF